MDLKQIEQVSRGIKTGWREPRGRLQLLRVEKNWELYGKLPGSRGEGKGGDRME